MFWKYNCNLLKIFDYSIDIDECTNKTDEIVDCGHGECRNIPGKYYCECDVGYDNTSSINCTGNNKLTPRQCFGLRIRTWLPQRQP